ncbi:MAG TPA: DUF2510 domain-containing protein [Microbacterium sp.]|nr:DUF2510 domain-containing protein [Microbacterium sp.]
MSDSDGSAKAGWYPTRVRGRERYWDGVRWTEMFRQAEPGGSDVIDAVVTSEDAP